MDRSILVAGAAAALLLIANYSPAPAASKEILELQRDVATLQDQMRQLQQSQDRQLAEIKTLVQQSLSAANDANRSVAVIQNGFQQNLRDQENKVVTPVVGLNTRMDNMSQDMRTLQQAVSDLTALLSKMQAQLTDLNNAVKVMQAPAAPPPGSAGSPGGIGAAPGGMPGAMAGGPPPSDTPTMPASALYDNANRDRQGGKLDLALQEFSDYLRWYGNTELAPNAQYYIASIHASQGDYDTAIREYDMVLEKYPDNNKTADAIYGKGVALARSGRRTDGAKEFQELIHRFPTNPLAGQACTQLTNMGLKCPSTTTRTTARRKKAGE
ncbi:MAG TPA: tetratricopeptide repeat protein [Bryobacteraceae bacterium]|jgi:TolA-binding protein|nr:tetratricopeptide repeat protein [Bryobacteraceae bacterium]